MHSWLRWLLPAFFAVYLAAAFVWPVFLGMRATLLGLFLVLPNAVTLAIVVLGEALIQIQVRLEEEFLSAKHGTRYAEYQRSTRRWL